MPPEWTPTLLHSKGLISFLPLPFPPSAVKCHTFIILHLDHGSHFLTGVPISSGHPCSIPNSDPSCTHISHIVFLSSCHSCAYERFGCLPGVNGVICTHLSLAIRDPPRTGLTPTAGLYFPSLSFPHFALQAGQPPLWSRIPTSMPFFPPLFLPPMPLCRFYPILQTQVT